MNSGEPTTVYVAFGNKKDSVNVYSCFRDAEHSVSERGGEVYICILNDDGESKRRIIKKKTKNEN